MKTITLNNGVEMPLQGFGVFQIAPQDCETAVRNALDVGYRMIDTAQAYYKRRKCRSCLAGKRYSSRRALSCDQGVDFQCRQRARGQEH